MNRHWPRSWACQETMMELSRKQLGENFYKTQMVYFILQRSHLPPPPPVLPALHQMPHFSQTLHPLLMNPAEELNFFTFFFFNIFGHCILWSLMNWKISPTSPFLEVKKIHKTVMHGNAPLEGWRFSFRGACRWIHKEVKPDKIKQQCQVAKHLYSTDLSKSC